MNNPFEDIKNEILELRALLLATQKDVRLIRQELTEGLPELMTRKQVAEYLQTTCQTVDALSRSGILIKCYKGNLVRFRREEVREAKTDWKD